MRPSIRPRSELIIYLGPEREVKRIALAETFAPGSTVTLKVAITVCAGLCLSDAGSLSRFSSPSLFSICVQLSLFAIKFRCVTDHRNINLFVRI